MTLMVGPRRQAQMRALYAQGNTGFGRRPDHFHACKASPEGCGAQVSNSRTHRGDSTWLVVIVRGRSFDCVGTTLIHIAYCTWATSCSVLAAKLPNWLHDGWY